ncbi:MAG: hypothetical protein M3331_00370 [Actinomycetota bacterium]|nr:hypothetical protein [Actinomycetota bacterium]
MDKRHSPDLQARLERLAQEIEFPPTPDLAPAVAARLEKGPGLEQAPRPIRPRIVPARRTLAIALAGLLAATATALAASPGLRDAVLDAFGIGGVRVERVPELPPLPAGGPSLGERLTQAEAEARAGFDLLAIHRPHLEPPAGVYVRDVDGTPIVSFSYRARPGLPPSPHTSSGLLLTQFKARLEQQLIGKVVAAQTGVTRVRIAGRPGYWLDGARHVLAYRTKRGSFEQSPRLAGNTLVWQRGPITLRLEGEISKARALRLARSVR